MKIALSVEAGPQLILESTKGHVLIPEIGDYFQLPDMKVPVTVKKRVFIYQDSNMLTVQLNLG